MLKDRPRITSRTHELIKQGYSRKDAMRRAHSENDHQYNNLYTVADIMKVTGLAHNSVCDYARHHRLGSRFGQRVLVFSKAELNKFQNRAKPGRPTNKES